LPKIAQKLLAKEKMEIFFKKNYFSYFIE